MGFEEVAGLASVHEDIEAAARMEKQIVSSTWMAGQDSSSVPRRHGDLLGASGAQLNIEERASFCLPHRRHRGEGRVGRRWGVGECWCGVVLQALRCLAFLLCLAGAQMSCLPLVPLPGYSCARAKLWGLSDGFLCPPEHLTVSCHVFQSTKT